MRTNEIEVLIVGAGPAGAALALHLARTGRDVLVLDASRFPRDKPCGDCVNPGAVRELRRLGVAGPVRQALRPRELSGWYIEAPDGNAFRARFGPQDGARGERGWGIRRRDLDAELLDQACHAGARVRFGLRVYDLIREDGRASGVVARDGTAVREIRARLVVGADGLRSVVRRRLCLSARPPRLKKIALVGHLPEANGSGGFGELRVSGGLCCGYAPLAVGANVTLVLPQSQVSRISGDPRGFFLQALSHFPAVDARVRRAGLDDRLMVTGPFDHPVRRPWAPGALLVGDAAGYYDPFTGQGIYQALRSARLAADAIAATLRSPSREPLALAAYGRRVRSELRGTRGVQRVIEAFISRPRAFSWIVRRALGEERRVGMQLIRVTGDLDPAAFLLDPRLWLRPAGQNARE